MGADGGICWVKVKDVKKFKDLVRPLELLWETSDYYDKYHYEYLDKNGPFSPDHVLSRYSNLAGHNFGFLDLEDIIGELKYIEDHPPTGFWDPYFGYTNPLNLTWEELLLDYITYPDLTYIRVPRMVDLLVYNHKMFFKNGKIEDHWRGRFPGFFEMKLRDWLRELTNIIYPNSFGHEETWT